MKKINQYIDEVFTQQDAVLDEVLASIKEKGMPEISVSPAAGKWLSMLVAMTGATNVLEIGALGGYSGIHLARGFGKDGTLTSLELEDTYAEVARTNLAKAGFHDQVTYITGPALDSLATLAKEKRTFDFFFIDADKGNYENYLEACIQIAELGAVIAADNVLARGSVAEDTIEPRKYTETMKEFNRKTANHPQLESLLLPVGDGLTVSQVKKKNESRAL
ncbi:O-methyltransferase [Alteribacillus iranensis]|uniref:Predicted O-methyltransferase YrrM n=1 Tax=Alteribacillus iranensis TaxID=930128 RepID=A0A1I2D5L4_9BACI|nr:O-methyltransferase [Alteribacillus iranensis]SFE75804.1 Predicted O-methyltransferase YrrM [Alteribacillus iranensis]